MPLSLVKVGRMAASRPEFSTEVVEASTIAREWAVRRRGPHAPAARLKRSRRLARVSSFLLPKRESAGTNRDADADQDKAEPER